uniref:Uncharacterized protein n=1 Tax=Ananas comosus var. bracteatus TaxID=296719 RepID=A0A6V7PHB7_ANACO|nr:unnamed protein product [Ananas comosus var. bracteatus]
MATTGPPLKTFSAAVKSTPEQQARPHPAMTTADPGVVISLEHFVEHVVVLLQSLLVVGEDGVVISERAAKRKRRCATEPGEDHGGLGADSLKAGGFGAGGLEVSGPGTSGLRAMASGAGADELDVVGRGRLGVTQAALERAALERASSAQAALTPRVMERRLWRRRGCRRGSWWRLGGGSRALGSRASRPPTMRENEAEFGGARWVAPTCGGAVDVARRRGGRRSSVELGARLPLTGEDVAELGGARDFFGGMLIRSSSSNSSPFRSIRSKHPSIIDKNTGEQVVDDVSEEEPAFVVEALGVPDVEEGTNEVQQGVGEEMTSAMQRLGNPGAGVSAARESEWAASAQSAMSNGLGRRTQ